MEAMAKLPEASKTPSATASPIQIEIPTKESTSESTKVEAGPPLKAIRCTLPNCRCECFSPGKTTIRTCDTCKHGWVAHALDKLGYRSIYQLGMQVEVVQPNLVFDIASLLLYGAQAAPIRLKILLDRLFSVLKHEEVLQVLNGFGWTYEDYARGYILQEANGHVLDKWLVATRDEEQIILQQFLRFGETKSIAQEIILQDTRDNREKQTVQTPKTESEIKKFIERSNVSIPTYLRNFDPRQLLAHPFMTGFPPVPTSATSGGRILSPPTIIPSYSPPVPTRDTALNMSLQTPQQSTPSSSPLAHLQTMQPFDYRRTHMSPTLSPVTNDKSVSPSIGSKSPENLSISAMTSSPTSSSTTPPSVISLTSPVKDQRDEIKYSGIPPLILPSDDESAEDGVINYSLKNGSGVDSRDPSPGSIYADRKLKHLRKSNNPMKRNWSPNPQFGQTFISATGKKRVLCTACNKTFCDKGALKIHYSAVHLKEMHKCSVEGCNMMFSSRRSRNRHSANPNPKLHMPNAKRKLPDGATILDENSSGISPLPTSIVSVPAAPISIPGLPVTSHMTLPVITPDVKALKLEPMGGDAAMLVEHGLCLNANGQVGSLLTSPAKVPKMELCSEPPMSATTVPTTSILSMTPISDTNIMMTSSSRRRKSVAPTRCPQQTPDDMCPSEGEENDLTIDCSDDMPENLSLKPNNCSPLNESMEIAEMSMSMECDGPEHDTSEQEGRETPVTDFSGISDLSTIQKKVIIQIEPRPDNESGDEMEPTVGDEAPHTANSPNSPAEECNGQPGAPAENSSAPCSPVSNGYEDCSEGEYENDEEATDMTDIPIDQENPCRCAVCGKMFGNHFGLKLHFQNDHLKLMHSCTIDGCNAAFPSKRSRDRHSHNLNLHRKLLSTSSGESDKSSPKSATPPPMSQSLREEFLPRIYDSHPFGDAFSQESLRYEGDNEDADAPSSRSPAHQVNGNGSASPSPHDGYIADIDPEDDSPMPDPDGTVKCHICRQPFRDNLILKEHYEKVHPKEMYQCTIMGCQKIFSTRKSRNRHSQNENLHRNMPPTQTNGSHM